MLCFGQEYSSNLKYRLIVPQITENHKKACLFQHFWKVFCSAGVCRGQEPESRYTSRCLLLIRSTRVWLRYRYQIIHTGHRLEIASLHLSAFFSDFMKRNMFILKQVFKFINSWSFLNIFRTQIIFVLRTHKINLDLCFLFLPRNSD